MRWFPQSVNTEVFCKSVVETHYLPLQVKSKYKEITDAKINTISSTIINLKMKYVNKCSSAQTKEHPPHFSRIKKC